MVPTRLFPPNASLLNLVNWWNTSGKRPPSWQSVEFHR
ncbi:hypothetical protein M8C21_012317 [Ambrosia artemisiifolia]|uniref:Uncharacterized protein n=1 Tax=Ambrosia artemisiifolia TaxID=4212 RepID=A0AAD5D809_AMBAR|nr:hypothetical protein M8C21_012317 [Ambrosia artemisiifolia]